MDVETITKLLDAGYTKEEIDKMGAGAEDQAGREAGEANENAGEKPGDAGAKNASEVGQDIPITAAIEALTNTVEGLKATVKAIQDSNAAGAATDKAGKDSIGDTIKSFMETL